MSKRKRKIASAGLAAFIAAVVLGGSHGCRLILPIFGYPPEANRNSPPPGIDDTRLKPAEIAPSFRLKGTLGEVEFSPPVAGSGRPLLLVFYRGHW